MNEKSIDNSADVGLILILPIALLIIFLFATWPLLLALVVASFSWNLWQGYQWQKWCQKVNPVFHQLIKENRGSITALDLAMKTNFSAAIAKRYLDTKAEEFGAQYQDYEDQGRVYYFMTASTLGKILDDSEPLSLAQQNDEINSSLLSENQNQLLHLEDATSPTPTEKQATSLIERPFEAPPEQAEPAAHIQSAPESLLQPEDEGERLNDEIDSSLLSENQNQLLHLEDATSPTPTEKQATSLIERPFEAPPEQAEPAAHIQSAPEYLLQSELAKRLDVHSSTVYKRRDDPDFPEWTRSKDPEGIAWKFIPDTKQFCPLETEL